MTRESQQSTYGPGNAAFDSSFLRPRRPNPETVSYLASLPLDERAEQSEWEYRSSKVKDSHEKKEGDNKVDNDDNDNEDEDDDGVSEIYSAAQNALEEIQGELASLAGDEMGSQRLETIAKIVCTATPGNDLNTRRMLGGMLGYYHHLSVNRYGSHVVQTLLMIATDQVRVNGSNKKSRVDNENDIDTLENIILAILDELMGSIHDLIIHVCGSHVLRALMTTLGGIVQVSAKDMLDPSKRRRNIRGKKARKKQNKDAMNNDSGVRIDLIEMVMLNFNGNDGERSLPDSFGVALKGLSEQLIHSSLSSENANNILSHPSAGPLVTTLLKVLVLDTHFRSLDKISNKPSEKESPFIQDSSPAEYLVHRFLGWDYEDDEFKQYVHDLCCDSTGKKF